MVHKRRTEGKILLNIFGACLLGDILWLTYFEQMVGSTMTLKVYDAVTAGEEKPDFNKTSV